MTGLKVLHIASFVGNIGDNANHNGFRAMMKRYVCDDIKYTNIEMREFYKAWNLRDFNSLEFVQLCNEHDLVVVGGGNFFELKWDYSHTGTTVNLAKDTLDKIKTPIFFNALGCDITKGYTENTIHKFREFLRYTTRSEQFMISFRNDGSKKTIHSLYGNEFENLLHYIPDPGFYFRTEEKLSSEYFSSKKFIGINIVSDMKDIRFGKGCEIDYESFINEFATYLDLFLAKYQDYNIVFFPHIYSDLEAITSVMEKIDHIVLRQRLIVAPYLLGEGSENQVFSMYKYCDLIIGMRFHSNVCAIGNSIPTIPLGSYPKIEELYDELALSERVVYVNRHNFSSRLMESTDYTLANLNTIRGVYEEKKQGVVENGKSFFIALKGWIEKQCL